MEAIKKRKRIKRSYEKVLLRVSNQEQLQQKSSKPQDQV
jgi:hypothetical protein